MSRGLIGLIESRSLANPLAISVSGILKKLAKLRDAVDIEISSSAHFLRTLSGLSSCLTLGEVGSVTNNIQSCTLLLRVSVITWFNSDGGFCYCDIGILRTCS